MRHAWIVASWFAACGGSPKPAEAPRAAEPTCATTAEHMVDFLASHQDPRPTDDAMNPLIGLIRTRCEADRWTAEARTCLRAMTSAQDADTCGTLLTDAQQAALLRDQEALMGARRRDQEPLPGSGADLEHGRGASPPPVSAPQPSPGAVPSTAGAPPPPPAPPPPARTKGSRAPARNADPCDGGE